MMLIEQTTVPAAALPVLVFKDHLRLGTGFADDGLQDAVLEQFLRSAMASIEARTGKVLISHEFLWSLTGWRAPAQQALPVAPVTAITAVRTYDRLGAQSLVDPSRYLLQRDDHRPRLVATGGSLPSVPTGGLAEVIFQAGFGASWGEIPADLAQAVFLLAAHYYENRTDTSSSGGAMPHGVGTLIARYRTVRILGGAGT